MKNISYSIGYWSAISLIVFFITWIICFAGIAATSPLFIWNGLTHYVSYVSAYNQTFATIAKVAMLFFGPAYLLMIHSFYDCSSSDKQPLARISLLFAQAFAVLSSLHYFVQLTAVKFSILNGLTLGVEHFLQANPYSFSVSVCMLGWTFFLGLSSLFMGMLFRFDNLNKWLKRFFYGLSFSCLMACVGYSFQIKWMLFLFVNVGTGGALVGISFKAMKYFKVLKRY